MTQISSLSTMYVKVRVSGQISGHDYDMTGDEVFLAFLNEGQDPSDADWHTGTWETEPQTSGTIHYLSRVLVGPNGTVNLPKGTYQVWVKLSDAPETPIMQSDDLIVY